jgi:hypothetical protein
VALFAPDHTRDNYRAQTSHGGHDGMDRGMRYLEWTWDPDPADSTYNTYFVYLLREPGGSVRIEHERFVNGLFGRDDWLRLLTEVGFHPWVVPFEHSEIEPGSCDLFVGSKPAGS